MAQCEDVCVAQWWRAGDCGLNRFRPVWDDECGPSGTYLVTPRRTELNGDQWVHQLCQHALWVQKLFCDAIKHLHFFRSLVPGSLALGSTGRITV